MPKRLTDLTLNEVSLVDNPANPGARVVLFKGRRANDSDWPVTAFRRDDRLWLGKFCALIKDARSFEDALDSMEAREAAWEVMDKVWKLSRALTESIESILDDEEAVNKQDLIAASVGQFRAALNSVLPEIEEVVEDRKSISLFDPTPVLKHYAEALMPQTNDKRIGDLEDQLADITKRLGKADAATKAAETRAEQAEAVLKLDAEARAFYDKLPEAERAGFLKLDAKVQAATVKKAADGDETLTVDGVTVRKSDCGDAMFAILKKQNERIEASERVNAEEIAKRELTEATVAVEKELPYMPGKPIEKAQAWIAIHKLDADEQKTVKTMLAAGSAALHKLTHGLGHVEPTEDSAQGQLDAMARTHAEKHNVSFQKAYAAVLETPEGRKLYAEDRRQTKVAKGDDI